MHILYKKNKINLRQENPTEIKTVCANLCILYLKWYSVPGDKPNAVYWVSWPLKKKENH